MIAWYWYRAVAWMRGRGLLHRYSRHALERIVIPALQDDRKVAVDALLSIERLSTDRACAGIASSALDDLEVHRDG